jgi:cysteinyl-tRNA synthetase
MDDDFNTPQAIAALFDLAADINRAAAAAMQGDRAAAGGLAVATETLKTLAGVLGFRIDQPALSPDAAASLGRLLDASRTSAPALFGDGAAPSDAGEIVAVLLAAREQARQQRRFDVADQIRRGLGDLGIIVEDLPGGPRWRVATRREAST